jgi:hypothetical protein
MPPRPAFNWLTVAHSALQILDHALKYRATQVQLTRVSTARVPQNQRHPHEEYEDSQGIGETAHSLPEAFVQQSSLLEANEAWLGQLRVAATPLPPLSGTALEAPIPPGTIPTPSTLSPNPAATATLTEAEAEPSATYPLVLEAEVKVPRRHDPLPQEVLEAPLQDVRPPIIVHSSKDKSASGTCFPSRVRTTPSVLQSPVFPYWTTISLWR